MIAIGAGFALVAAGVALVGPQVSGVVAGDDAGIREFLSREARRAAPPTLRPVAYAPAPNLIVNVRAQRAIAKATRGPEARRARRPQTASATLAKAVHATSGALSVCVRACDGYHFPIAPIASSGDVAGHAALCASLCPGAQTQLYTLAPGADGIEKAVSRNGKPYSALSTALRYTAKTDKACTCAAPGVTQASYVSLYRDFTLRRGDSVMTAKGVRVFAGAKRYPFRNGDFVRLSGVDLPKPQRSALIAIERASKRGPAAYATPSQPPAKPVIAAPPRLIPQADGRPIRAVGPLAEFTPR